MANILSKPRRVSLETESSERSRAFTWASKKEKETVDKNKGSNRKIQQNTSGNDDRKKQRG